jgi:hypothetical protein
MRLDVRGGGPIGLLPRYQNETPPLFARLALIRREGSQDLLLPAPNHGFSQDRASPPARLFCGRCHRWLIINLPPRHLKSLTVSVAWPDLLAHFADSNRTSPEVREVPQADIGT